MIPFYALKRRAELFGARGALGDAWFPLLTEASSQGWAMRSICKAVMYPKTMRDCEARAIFCTRPPYLALGGEDLADVVGEDEGIASSNGLLERWRAPALAL